MEMNKEELFDYYQYLVPDGKWQRLGTTFQTENAKYFYDAGTTNVFECNDQEFLVLENILAHSGLFSLDETGLPEAELLDALENIKELTEKYKICQATAYQKFQTQEMDFSQNSLIQQVIFELTEQCNLRCKYCIYGEENERFRNFSGRNMSWEIAKKGLDYVFAHSGDEISVTFYGGEPLLQFPLMKQCMDYTIEKVGKEKKIEFGFTTNLTLVTREMAEYFASLDFCAITGSLDGPEDIHDAYRVTQNKMGSFKKAMEGLKLLIDCMGQERASNIISINAVMTPPYTVEKAEYINQFFRSIPWLPKNMTIRSTYVERPKKKGDGVHQTNMKGTIQQDDPVEYWKLVKICKKEEKDIGFNTDNTNLTKIHNRMISEVPIPFLRQNGCCNPGNRRLYITTEGKFHVCERIGESPAIGDVDHGLDADAIKKYYIDEYAQASLPDCCNCWAAQLCSLCFASFYNKNGIDIQEKRRLCAIQRQLIKYNLIAYHQIMETNPEYINQYCNKN